MLNNSLLLMSEITVTKVFLKGLLWCHVLSDVQFFSYANVQILFHVRMGKFQITLPEAFTPVKLKIIRKFKILLSVCVIYITCIIEFIYAY